MSPQCAKVYEKCPPNLHLHRYIYSYIYIYIYIYNTYTFIYICLLTGLGRRLIHYFLLRWIICLGRRFWCLPKHSRLFSALQGMVWPPNNRFIIFIYRSLSWDDCIVKALRHFNLKRIKNWQFLTMYIWLCLKTALKFFDLNLFFRWKITCYVRVYFRGVESLNQGLLNATVDFLKEVSYMMVLEICTFSQNIQSTNSSQLLLLWIKELVAK